MSFARYRLYRDSGIEWLGEVPAHWSIQRLRTVATLNPPKGELRQWDRDTPVSFLPMEAIGDDGSLDLGRERALGEVEAGYSYFRNGDVAIAKITPCFENGKGAVMRGLRNGVGFGTTELIVVRPDSGYVRPEFLHYLFNSRQFRGLGEAHMYGAGGQQRVPDEFVRNFALPLPPPAEQADLVSFLDEETAKLDALVAEQQRLFVLLREKRQALVAQSVLRGLNRYAPLRPSGVAWLGDVPAHWQVVRLATLLREVAEAGSDELPILSVSIHDGVSDRELGEAELARKVTRSEDRSTYKRVRPGDLVYNMMRAWQGAFGAVQTDGMVSPAYVVARPVGHVPAAYLEHVLRTPQAVTEMRGRSRGVTDFRLRLYWEEFKDMRVPVPPEGEIGAILRASRGVSAEVDAMTTEAECAINLLQERRASLISAAVTGQIDVRTYRSAEELVAR